MASTPAQPGAYDALEKAAPGEPMFPLLGRDPCAPAAITEWCRLRRNLALKEWGESANPRDKELLAAELRQCANAEAVALEFNSWREDHTEAAVERASYQPVIKSADEQAMAAKRHRRDHMGKSLREAAYYLQEAKEAATALEMPAAALILNELQSEANRVADAVQEQRPAAMLPLEGPNNG